MSFDLAKKRVHKPREVAPARRSERSASAYSPAANVEAPTRVEELDPVKNPAWRLTAAGQKAPTTPPWLLVTLAFGLPFLLLIVLSFLL